MSVNKTPLYMVIYHEIKDKILSGVLKKNTKIDSVRSFAVKRQISTTTVEKAYNQLVVEGYLQSVPKSGFTVVDIQKDSQLKSNNIVESISYKQTTNNKLTEDLFDIKLYKSIINKIINYHSDTLYTACDPRGEYELRQQIQKYVYEERNISCDIDQIVIGSGIQQLLQMLLLIQKGTTVTYLTPEFKKAIDVFRMNQYEVKPSSSIDEVCETKSDFLYISPSNIYPTGDVVKMSERYRLLQWAKKNTSFIIEDDYNFFIRYNSYTIPSIFSYSNNEDVIYMGSFSKTLLPSIRLSFMILPIPIYDIFKHKYTSFSQGVSKLEQMSLALYMKEGLFKRHTKKLHSLYKEKNLLILKELEKYPIKVSGTDSNLHVIITFETKNHLQQFTNNCNSLEYGYELIDELSLIFPYSGLNNEEIPQRIEFLFS